MKCKHECDECSETWDCGFPYYSEFQYSETSLEHGYYCNSHCPTCKEDERQEIDGIFENMTETGYVNSL